MMYILFYATILLLYGVGIGLYAMGEVDSQRLTNGLFILLVVGGIPSLFSAARAVTLLFCCLGVRWFPARYITLTYQKNGRVKSYVVDTHTDYVMAHIREVERDGF